MSIYVMTIRDLAKKRGEPVGDFIKKVNELGFEAGSHAKRLTQEDLDILIGLLTNSSSDKKPSLKENREESSKKIIKNPNVLLVNLSNGKFKVVYVDVTLDDSEDINLDVIESSTENSSGEALLEFRKQMGMKMGIN